MMTALECYSLTTGAQAAERQLLLNQFIDDFRRATPSARWAAIAEPIVPNDSLAALLAATVETLCVEVESRPPPWVATKVSPEPFFAFDAKSFPLRVRLMIESPPAFKLRRVFVPDNFLQRA